MTTKPEGWTTYVQDEAARNAVEIIMNRLSLSRSKCLELIITKYAPIIAKDNQSLAEFKLGGNNNE